MEENQKKDLENQADFSEDFADFDDEEVIAPEIEEEIEEVQEETKEKTIKEVEEISEIQPVDKIKEEQIEEKIEAPLEIEQPQEIEEVGAPSENLEKTAPKEEVEVSQWEELDSNNSVVKKYIFYVSKDFTPYLDDLTTDQRSAYINDAIQKKIDLEQEKNKINEKKRITNHFIIMALTFLIATPVTLLFAHKAIMATFENYKYSQENFEKLYRQRFEHDRAYMRSVQYNKQLQEKLKNKEH